MNTELILLIISLFSNAVIILKKIRVIWTPCLIIQCGNDEENTQPETNASTDISKFKRFLTRLTPRKSKPPEELGEIK